MDPTNAKYQQHQQIHRQMSPAIPSGGASSSGGATPAGASWVSLKAYPSRQPGQPYRGVRFNRATNQWISLMSYQGREVEIGAFNHEEEAALAHDKRTVELYGATSPVNFQYDGLVDPATMKVYVLRTPSGQEMSLSPVSGGIDNIKSAAAAAPPEHHYRQSASSHMSSSGVLGASRFVGGAGGPSRQQQHHMHHHHQQQQHQLVPPRLMQRPQDVVADDPSALDEWAPRSEDAYTAKDQLSVSNALQHDASLVYEVVFPRTGPLGLNLRSYFAVPPAGARPNAPLYGCLEVLEAQNRYLQVVVESGDFLLAVNGKKLSGTNFVFESAIGECSKAPTPRVLRFARMRGASAAELECALEGTPCAIFDAVDDPPHQRLVTAQLHPSAPPFFHLNTPTRQGAFIIPQEAKTLSSAARSTPSESPEIASTSAVSGDNRASNFALSDIPANTSALVG